MRAPYWLLAAAIALVGLAILTVLILFDPPKAEAQPVSVSYWHYLDETEPREDTAHYIIPFTGGQNDD